MVSSNRRVIRVVHSLPEGVKWDLATGSANRSYNAGVAAAGTRPAHERFARCSWRDLRPMWHDVVPAVLRPRGEHIVRALGARAAMVACALLLMSGCAKTTVTDEQYYQGPRLAKPARILVYDFAASQADLPAGYGTAVSAPPTDQTADDLSLGRKLGAEVAKDLVEELQ